MWRCAAYMGLVLTILLCLMTGCGKPATQQQSGKERIVSLAPNLTEIVCAVGGADQLVGRTTACNYPPDVVARVPAIGGFGAPSLEVLLALKPTRILYVDLEDQNFAQKMDAVGLTHTKVRCKTLDDIPRAVWEVGGYLHQESVAGQLAEKLTVGMAALRDRLNHPPTVRWYLLKSGAILS